MIAGDLVIAGFDGGRVTALELKTGKLIWERRVAISRGRSELERMVDVDAQPLIIGDIIYISSFQANVTALSLDSVQVLSQMDISSHSDLVAYGSRLYVTDDHSHVWALDRFSGSSIWKQEKLQARRVTGPTVIGDKVVVGDLEGYLHWLDKDTGDFSARNQLSDAPILASAISTEDKLFVYSSDGRLAAYSYRDNGVVIQRQVDEVIADSAGDEQQLEASDTETAASESSAEEEDEDSFFGRVLDIFSGSDEVDTED